MVDQKIDIKVCKDCGIYSKDTKKCILTDNFTKRKDTCLSWVSKNEKRT